MWRTDTQFESRVNLNKSTLVRIREIMWLCLVKTLCEVTVHFFFTKPAHNLWQAGQSEQSRLRAREALKRQKLKTNVSYRAEEIQEE